MRGFVSGLMLSIGLAGCLNAVDVSGTEDGGAICQPQCAGKECGADGCGGQCGTCSGGEACDPATLQCVSCQPQCAGKECGEDGCGNQCGQCAEGLTCSHAYACMAVNDSCQGAIALDLGTGSAVVRGTTALATHSTSGSCAGYTAPDRVYSLEMTAAHSLRITLTTGDPDYYPALFLRTVCDSEDRAHEVGCAPKNSGGSTVVEEVLSVPMGTYYLWVGGDLGSVGEYTLTVELGEPILPPANDTCAMATPLTLVPGSTLTLSGSTLAGDNTTSGSCAGSWAPDVVYLIHTTSEQSLKARLTTAGWEGCLYLRTSCAGEDLSAELACEYEVGPLQQLRPARLPAGDYWLWVDGGGGEAGSFSLDLTLEAPLAPPANDSCGGASELQFTDGRASVTDTLFLATPSAAGSCGGATSGDVVYQFTTDAPRSLTAKLTDLTPSLYPALYLRKACDSVDAADELGCDAPFSDPAQVAVRNLPAGTYWLWVDGDLGTTGDYRLDVQLEEAIPTPPNDTCQSPGLLDLSAGTVTVTGDLRFAENDTTGQCGGKTSSDLVYELTTGAAHSLTAKITTDDPTFSPVISLRRVCDSEAAQYELACQYADADTALFTIPNLGAGTYWLWVDGAYGSVGTYTLTVTAAPPIPAPANDLCSGAQELFKNQPVTGSTVSAINDYGAGPFSSACSLGYSYDMGGKELIYRFRPSTSGTFLVMVTADPGYDVGVWTTSGNSCGGSGAACVAAADSGAAGVTEIMAVNGVAGTDYFIVVDSMWDDVGGGFTIEVR